MKLNKLLFPLLLLSVALVRGQQVPVPLFPEEPVELPPVVSPPEFDPSAPGVADPSAPPVDAAIESVPIGVPALPVAGDLSELPPPPPPPDPDGKNGGSDVPGNDV
ncbi:MAG: hypothetical protein VX633_11090, partial [Verrucomicrobiota bacterium]|nr:hypothetical protein [Verrucomicrobiota bacterium]